MTVYVTCFHIYFSFYSPHFLQSLQQRERGVKDGSEVFVTQEEAVILHLGSKDNNLLF